MDRARTPDEILAELFASCATDCADGCRFGCTGWLHRFGLDQEAGRAGDLPAYKIKAPTNSNAVTIDDHGTGTGSGVGEDGA